LKNKNRGHEFEKKILGILKDVIDETWGIRSAYCTFHNRKRYYSNSRESVLEIDVSIEIKRQDQKDWYQLMAFECKKRKAPVGVNHIEKFKAQVDQVAGKNVKAFVVSESGFTSGAESYSKNNGIGLITCVDRDFDNVVEFRSLAEPIEYEPEYNFEVLRCFGRHDGWSLAVNHYKQSVRFELFADYFIRSSPLKYRQANFVTQCEPFEPGKLEFHVAENDDFLNIKCSECFD
jgi:hypothetical protein